MNDSGRRINIIIAGIFLAIAAFVMGLLIAGMHSTDTCRPQVTSTGPTPGLMPHATDIHCTAP